MSTDRQIIERLLIPAMMSALVTTMARGLGERAPALGPIQALLGEALAEPVRELAPERVAKLVRRAKRATTLALTAITGEGRTLAAQYLAVSVFTARLSQDDILVVGADSSFARAWDLLAEIIEVSDADRMALDDEAVAAAGRLAESLAAQGYYRSANP